MNIANYNMNFAKKELPNYVLLINRNRITIFKNGMKQQIKPRARFNPKLEKKLPYYCCCLVGRSVDLETTFFLFFHILIFYLKLCFCSYNKALTSSFFWLLLGNQSKSEIDLRWKISALFLSYCLLFWNDLEYIPTFKYIIYIFFVT